MARGFKTGGRKPLTAAGPGVSLTVRVPREIAEDLSAMAAETKKSSAEIARLAIAARVARWRRDQEKRKKTKPTRRRVGKHPGQEGGTP